MCNKKAFQSKTNRPLANRCRDGVSLCGREWGWARDGPKLKKLEKERGNVACK